MYSPHFERTLPVLGGVKGFAAHRDTGAGKAVCDSALFPAKGEYNGNGQSGVPVLRQDLQGG